MTFSVPIDLKQLGSVLYHRLYTRIFLAEFISTYIILLFVNGFIAQIVLTDGEKGGLNSKWGALVGSQMGMIIALGVSGAHSNPAFSLLFALRGYIPWIQLPVYWAAQYLGAFAGAASVLGVYWEALMNKTNGEFIITNDDPGYAVIFATYPAPYASVMGAIGDQILLSALLALCVAAITDQKNLRVPFSMFPLYVGYLVLGLAIAFSLNSGGSPNPARDLGPRLLSYCAGWGLPVFSYNNWRWFWIPFIVPHFGCILGNLTYFLLIENHWSSVNA